MTQIDYKAPLDEQGKELKKLLENAADKHELGFESRTWSMGCSLFTRPLETTFCVGPVCFEPKSTWLDRALEGNHISRTSRDRLTRAFAGQKLRPRKNTSEMAQERCILDVLETAQMACTVTIDGLAPKVGEHRSIVAARLAQATIALLWPNPSVVLSGFRLSVDHGVRLIRTIPFSAASRMIGGSRFVGMPHGPEMSSTEWNTITRNAQDFFAISGRMIACWTNSRAFRTETPLLRCLSQALFFFWEGCRDENNLMSIVEFTAALEALSQGKSSGILRLANAQLGLQDTDEFILGKTLKQVVTLIYSEGRSRTLHGTNEKILHDWSETRMVAELLTRLCIVNCMDWAIRNPKASAQKCLLK